MKMHTIPIATSRVSQLLKLTNVSVVEMSFAHFTLFTKKV